MYEVLVHCNARYQRTIVEFDAGFVRLATVYAQWRLVLQRILISCEQKFMYDLMRIGRRASEGLMGEPEFGYGDWYARSVWIFRVICDGLKRYA